MEAQEVKAKLGCPKECKGWTCVDVRGEFPVVRQDVYVWLEDARDLKAITSKNLLEHLPDPGRFFKLCHGALTDNGKLSIITDNAEFLPFYLPFWIRHTGIGAHSLDAYALDHCNSRHYMIFTKMHLRNLMENSGFRSIEVRRILFGSRLLASGIKHGRED